MFDLRTVSSIHPLKGACSHMRGSNHIRLKSLVRSHLHDQHQRLIAHSCPSEIHICSEAPHAASHDVPLSIGGAAENHHFATLTQRSQEGDLTRSLESSPRDIIKSTRRGVLSSLLALGAWASASPFGGSGQADALTLEEVTPQVERSADLTQRYEQGIWKRKVWTWRSPCGHDCP